MKQFLSIFFLCIAGVISANAQALSDGEYLIKINQTGKYIAIAGASKDNGAWAIQWDNEYSSHFRFMVKHIGNNVYTLQAKHSGKYLSTLGSPAAGAKLIQWDWLNQDNQKWYILPQKGSNGYVLSCYQNNMKVVTQYWNANIQPRNGEYFFLQGNRNIVSMVLDFKKNETDQIEGNQNKTIPIEKRVIPKTRNNASEFIRGRIMPQTQNVRFIQHLIGWWQR
jgi:Ricin-type beta-trefoil lectin domain-like